MMLIKKYKNNLKPKIDIVRKQAKRVWLWLVAQDFLIFLLFVGLVTIFWWGRSMSSPRDLNMEVEVVYSGIDEQVVFAHALPEYLDLTIRDNGKQLRQINKSLTQVECDMQAMLEREEGTVVLSAEQWRQKLQDQLPGSTQIQKIAPEHFASAYYRLAEKKVPVEVVSHITVAAQHQMVDSPSAMPDSVRIFGSRQVIDSISCVKTAPTYIDGLRERVAVTSALELPEGVTAEREAVEIACAAELFTEKSFTLPIKMRGLPEGVSMRLFPQQVTIVVRVGMSHFAQVHAADFKAYCQYPKQASTALEVQIEHRNPYIKAIRISPEKVEYMINQ